ncbi:MAG: fluoride efflux transporter CrcB [Phycisphaerales bacterium]|nr:fluoride efflux transporter CrcB [Phycisphaerales bacterium]
MLRTYVLQLLLNKYTLVALGGAFGSLLRYLVQGWIQALTRGTFPIGTLVVNVVGCFAIGAINMVLAERVPIRMEYRVGLTIGILGGFTTFSTLGWETFSLANDEQWLKAGLNVLLSVSLGLVAVWMGYRLAERMYGV